MEACDWESGTYTHTHIHIHTELPARIESILTTSAVATPRDNLSSPHPQPKHTNPSSHSKTYGAKNGAGNLAGAKNPYDNGTGGKVRVSNLWVSRSCVCIVCLCVRVCIYICIYVYMYIYMDDVCILRV